MKDAFLEINKIPVGALRHYYLPHSYSRKICSEAKRINVVPEKLYSGVANFIRNEPAQKAYLEFIK